MSLLQAVDVDMSFAESIAITTSIAACLKHAELILR
jgi:hypothetical protein